MEWKDTNMHLVKWKVLIVVCRISRAACLWS